MDNKLIGNNIKRFRKQAGLTQIELAEKINRSEMSIRKYENGEVNIPISVLTDIAKALNVWLADLTMDGERIRATGNILKDVEKHYGKIAMKILAISDLLNEKGQNKVLQYVCDLGINPQYTKSVDDSFEAIEFYVNNTFTSRKKP